MNAFYTPAGARGLICIKASRDHTESVPYSRLAKNRNIHALLDLDQTCRAEPGYTLMMEDKTPATTPVNYGELPLVYSCSGCPNTAQLANTLAVRLDREGFAEMSCIAGICGDVKPIVNKASSGRPIIALDGCPLNCAKSCLKRHGIEPQLHIELSAYGIRKSCHEDVPGHETERAWKNIILIAIRHMTRRPSRLAP
jgi:uncharacterized metal-binding protein